MKSYLSGTSLLVGYQNSMTVPASVIGYEGDWLGADALVKTAQTSAERYERLKRLPVSELKVRADRVLTELKKWQTNVLADDNARAYAAALEQAQWQKANGDKATDDEDKRLAYARCVHMAEDSLLAFTSMGPGDSYWDTYLENLKKGAELARDAARNLLKAPGTAFEWLTGVPSWIFWCTAGAIILGTGYGIYKIAMAAAPGVVSSVAQKYLP